MLPETYNNTMFNQWLQFMLATFRVHPDLRRLPLPVRIKVNNITIKILPFLFYLSGLTKPQIATVLETYKETDYA